MSHIRYLSSRARVCDQPGRLGQDFIFVDHSEENCKECVWLVEAYNRKADREDQIELLLQMGSEPHISDVPVRGVVYGILIASCFWLLVIGILVVMMVS